MTVSAKTISPVSSSSNATPRPWYSERMEHIAVVRSSRTDDGEFTIFTTEYGTSDDIEVQLANAALIVEAVNAYAALKQRAEWTFDALLLVRQWMDGMPIARDEVRMKIDTALRIADHLDRQSRPRADQNTQQQSPV